MVPTPECDKLKAIQDRSQAIGGFLEYLGENGMEICRRSTKEERYDLEGEDTGIREGQLLPIYKSIEVMLAEYFKIDLNKVESEKRAILEEIRSGNIS